MSIAIIINPIAGGLAPHAVPGCAEQAASAVAAAGEVARVFVTERPGHARELAQGAAAAGARLVFAWGGDGTVNEVASALAFGPTPLGIVPAGSGNGLARELGVDRRPGRAIAAGMRAAPRRIDAGELDGRLFFNVAGIGFDAHIASRFAAETGVRRGLRRYVAISIRELRSYQPRTCRVTVNGVAATRRAFLISLANSAQFGNGARVAPGALLDDGWLDLVIVEERSRLATIAAAPRLFLGGLERVPGVTRQLVDRLRIDSDGPIAYHIDGDPYTGGCSLEARVHPSALWVSGGS